ncbi:hypothetical protein MJO28_013543 [Puccinia striiformis f. sp. tritici]|uniref:Uncharacterized protein n=4 Tax=Puccinia striiformis TaxID=27350 RepID=A0A0L0V5F1_9BASI|nr:hypothetical protein Pst134EA_025957 [Puccinia striiformis f. sp. tritici]KAI9615210.1 hypothetical protein H4Q26_011752 [Puccinia striiformis f. sp. tritici PST-130]KNE94483.1 hypothetical protein PSTG_12130 [Puccinia striiformis f. sp. tritici PST-78]POW12510.1 hypothetical protein PSHT_08083 [Puccinia striiformis]KAH9444174.1 hypothetical protein Pst134EB_026553 [Puccinia striiformis f. sp. tritici]KAH9452022.1 hypothetical protein Pst134EA_025957 [Puccinia striiformis f. sp. tritici]
MSPVGQVDGPTEGADRHLAESRWVNQSSSSIASSEGKSDKKCPVIRATTPSRYLKRTGLMPNGPHLQVITTYKTSIISSSSSSSPRSPSSAATNWAITSTSGAFHLDTPCSSGLTKSNLAELMEQLNIPGLTNSTDCAPNPTSQSPIEISHFSDGSGSHSGSDCE